MRKLYTIVFLLTLGFTAKAQYTRTIDSLMAIPLIQVNYAFDIPGGDLAKRFGNNHELGAGFFYKSKKGWLYGVEGGFIFGNQLRDDANVINTLRTENGEILGANGETEGFYPNVRLHQRGYKIPQFKFGKLFHHPILKGSDNSGPFIMGGAGFMQYKVKIQDVDRVLPQLSGDYVKGYDHLTNGITTAQSIGYMYLDKHKLMNLSISFEFMQGFTQNRRDWNADTRSPENDPQFDLMYGFKISWFVPLYPKLSTGYYYQ